LENHLVTHSRLPGPRGNLELASAFADVVAAAAGLESGRLWGLMCALSSEGVDSAPVNDPREFLVFCGVLGIGALAGADGRYQSGAAAKLRGLANDPRWRTREAVAMGLQRLFAASPRDMVKELSGWIGSGNWLEMRAAAAGIAEPALLRDTAVSRAALEIHRRILDRIFRSADRGSEGFRTLRKGLGYSLSVVVAARPVPGFNYLRELAEVDDPDIRWILKSNVKKRRLTRDFSEDIARLELE
jgi:hypothetical protein